MTELPSVGVVVPTRDRPALLRATLAAIADQDYPGPVTVLVVHDGSAPDHSVASDQVAVCANTRTPGLAGARNTGILALRTELVAFCDDDDRWLPDKLRRQVDLLAAHPQAPMVTCAIAVEFADTITARPAGTSTVTLAQLTRRRMAMLHSSTFVFRRTALTDGPPGLVAEDAPGSQNEDWDLLIRAARHTPIPHLDAPLVRVLWGQTSQFAHQYGSKVAALRWMLDRHPELRADRPGAARVFGQLACWSAATGDRHEAWRWTRQSLRHNWREPRAAIALAALTGCVKVEQVIGVLHRRGRGI